MSKTDLTHLLNHLSPELNSEPFVMVTIPKDDVAHLIDFSIAMVREDEGITLVLPECIATDHGLPHDNVFKLISLRVESDLLAVGLTAAFATELAKHDIPANVLAGFYHDHLLVPDFMSEMALDVLNNLSKLSR